MKNLIPFFLLLVVGFTSCDESSKFYEVEQPAPAVQFLNFPEKPIKVNTPVNLRILHETRNGCGRFSRVDSATVDKVYTMQYFVLYPEEGQDVVCSALSKPLTFRLNFLPREVGTYRFRFWRAPNDYVEKVIEVAEVVEDEP